MKVSNLIPMNLQLFASSEGIESSVNADPVANVEPQQTEQVTQPESVNGEVATPQESKPVQSAEENARYAAIRRETEQRTKDSLIAEMGYTYNGMPITTYAEYQQALKDSQRQQEVQQQAQKYNADPELMAYIKGLEDKVSTIEQQTQVEREAAEKQAFEKQIQSQVNEIMDLAKKEGFEVTEEQLLNAAIENNLTDMKKVYKLIKPDVDMETLKQNAVKEYIERLKTGNVPVEASGTTPSVVTETPKSFDDALKGARAMLKASNIFK